MSLCNVWRFVGGGTLLQCQLTHVGVIITSHQQSPWLLLEYILTLESSWPLFEHPLLLCESLWLLGTCQLDSGLGIGSYQSWLFFMTHLDCALAVSELQLPYICLHKDLSVYGILPRKNIFIWMLGCPLARERAAMHVWCNDTPKKSRYVLVCAPTTWYIQSVRVGTQF